MYGKFSNWKDKDELKTSWEKAAKSIRGYDVHIYFDPNSAEGFEAKRLAEALVHAFPAVTSQIFDVPVTGPHTKPNVEVQIDKQALGNVMQFLQMNRGNLSVLVHPRTGDEMEDHHRSALWLGDKVPLSKSFFDAWEKRHAPKPRRPHF